MSLYSLYIAGVKKPIHLGSLELSAIANGIDTLFADLDDPTGTYRPALDAIVILEDDAAGSPTTRLFGGYLTEPGERGLAALGDVPIVTGIHAADFNVLAQRVYLNETLPADSLKAGLIRCVAALNADGYAVTLDPAQVTGPTLPELLYPYGDASRLDKVLPDLVKYAGGVTNTGWVYEIDYYMVLRAYEVSTVPAPFDVPGAIGPVGDMEVTPKREDTFANRIILVLTSTFQPNRVETFNLVAQSVISLGALAAGPASFRGYLTENGNPKNIGTGPAQWVWDLTASPQTLTRAAGPFTGTVVIVYDGTVSGSVVSNDLASQTAHGIWEAVETIDNLFDPAVAQTIADAILAERSQLLKTVTYTTFDDGLKPGQTQHVTVPIRNLDDDMLITQVVTRELADAPGVLSHEVTGIIGTSPSQQGNWREIYKKWLEAGSTEPIFSPGGGTAAAAPPIRSVQFNRAGSFGGSADVLEDEDDTGDVYGAVDEPARLAIGMDAEFIPGSPSPGDHVQLAIFNRAAGLPNAFTIQQIDDGTTYFQQEGQLAFVINENLQFFAGGANGGIDLVVNNAGTQTIRLSGLAQMYAQSVNTTYVTGNHTLDSTIGIGGAPNYAIIHHSASNHTLSLTALASTFGAAGGNGRIIYVINDTTGGTFTIDPNGSETINSAASLVLQPGQSVAIMAWTGTGPEWKAFGGIGNIAVGGGGTTGTGDVVGPSSATDGAVAGFDGTTGKLIKELQAIDLIAAASYLTIGVPSWTPADAGEVLTISAGRAPTASNDLIFLNIEPGSDTLRTIPVGQSFFGLYAYPVAATAGSGTHALLALNYFDVGSFTAGGATVTEAATVYIAGDPGIGTNRHALFVNGGVSFFGGLIHGNEAVLISELTFASLPSPVAGMMANISDCNTNTWGATAAGGGANRVLVRYNGTNWTVVGK